jgi:hypothetical protein
VFIDQAGDAQDGFRAASSSFSPTRGSREKRNPGGFRIRIPFPLSPAARRLSTSPSAAIAARHLAVIDSLSSVRAQHQIADLVTSKSSRIRSPLSFYRR